MVLTPDRWGKDHWRLLLLLEQWALNGAGGWAHPDPTQLRCHPERHPEHVTPQTPAWLPSMGTRLTGYFAGQSRDAAMAESTGAQMPDHDDWDCLADLLASGWIQAGSRGAVRFTFEGHAQASRARWHLLQGHHLAQFKAT